MCVCVWAFTFLQVLASNVDSHVAMYLRIMAFEVVHFALIYLCVGEAFISSNVANYW